MPWSSCKVLVYLQLHERETSAGSNAAVVLDCGTSNDRPELVDWARSDRGGFGDTGCPAAGFATGLGRDESVRDKGIGIGESSVLDRSGLALVAANLYGSLNRDV